ncbi:MAG TPA: maleylacetate reductase [Solirubrobacterales bacterium]|nr:maleylacetate reductase [Solirubrobacterales bacterium]
MTAGAASGPGAPSVGRGAEPAVTVGRLVYEALPGRVVFGAGAIDAVAGEAELLGAERALLVVGRSDPGRRERVERALGARHAGTVDEVAQHVPAAVAERAVARARELGADALVALGGGSAIGLAKAVALETGTPILAVPTTYAGSEMTPIWGITSGGRKTTGSDPRALPRAVVYDPELTLSLPPRFGAASGMNAVAHCVEALWTPAANPVTDAVAGEGIARLARGLRAAHADPADLAARTETLQGAWLAGTALAVAGTGLHHKLCHVLGGSFGLPHAEVHAAVLPFVVDYYRGAAPGALDRVAAALGAEDAVTGLRELARDLDLGGGLADLGLRAEDLDLAAERAAAPAPPTPTPIDRAGIKELLERALVGTGAGRL